MHRIVPCQHEEALVALDVVLLDRGLPQLEMDGGRVEAQGRLDREAVVGEGLARLDVVLVEVGPVEEDLLAVVGDGVLVALAVAPLRDKVAVVVVAGEEAIEFVVGLSLELAGQGRRLQGLLGAQVRFPQVFGRLSGQRHDRRSQIALRVERLIAVFGLQLLAGLVELLLCPGLMRLGLQLQALRDGVEQVVLDEALDFVALVVHHGIDAEIQVGAVELEELAEQSL